MTNPSTELGGDPTGASASAWVGFRFVADVVTTPRVAIVRAEAEGAPAAPMLEAARPAIAVLRFRLVGIAGPHAAIAEALPHELIAQLSRLRFNAGADSFLTVLDAERTLAAADAALASSDALVTTYQIALFKALAGGWVEEG